MPSCEFEGKLHRNRVLSCLKLTITYQTSLLRPCGISSIFQIKQKKSTSFLMSLYWIALDHWAKGNDKFRARNCNDWLSFTRRSSRDFLIKRFPLSNNSWKSKALAKQKKYRQILGKDGKTILNSIKSGMATRQTLRVGSCWESLKVFTLLEMLSQFGFCPTLSRDRVYLQFSIDPKTECGNKSHSARDKRQF